jgi:Flp pilus assembly pilin Flp
MRATLASFLRDDRGEDLIEYGLLAAFAAGVAMVAIVGDPLSIRPAIIAAFNKAKAVLEIR